MSRRVADVPCRMDLSRRDQQFFSGLRMMHLAGNLELHFAVHDNYQLVSGMREVIPALTGRIGPQIAAESTICPFGGYCLTVLVGHLMTRSGRFFLPRTRKARVNYTMAVLGEEPLA